jgi:hypothetical protein
MIGAVMRDIANNKPKQTQHNLPVKVGRTTIPRVELDDRAPQLNSAGLLDLVHAIFTYFARWDNPHDPVLATLWAASTWFREPANDGKSGPLRFKAHPRLMMIAPPGSGKTRIMKITRAFSNDPTGIVKAPVTAPGVRDALDAGRTIFLDEIDRQIGAGRAHMDVQALISAYEADTGSLNGRGGVNEQNIFGPMMLAAKPKLLTGTNGYIEDLFERSFILNPVKWTGDPIPDLNDEFDDWADDISKVLKLWGATSVLAADGKNVWPIHTVPKVLTSRMREISQPFLAVADRAVDPDVLDLEGKDIRWALAARTAVKERLLDHGENGNAILAGVADRMLKLGVKL